MHAHPEALIPLSGLTPMWVLFCGSSWMVFLQLFLWCLCPRPAHLRHSYHASAVSFSFFLPCLPLITLKQTCLFVSEMLSALSLSLVSVPLRASSLLCDMSSCDFSTLLFFWCSPVVCLISFTAPLRHFSTLGLFGLNCQGTWVSGLELVSVASGAKSKPMFMLQFLPSLFLSASSPTFTWIMLALFPPAMISPTSSP